MEENIQDKKGAALKAALELISEQGFHGAPMSQIAERARIGVGTIYRYFNSKDDLINALYIDIKTRLVNYICQHAGKTPSLQEGFRTLLLNVIRYCRENPAELSFVEQYENSPQITAATRAEAVRIAAPINALFGSALEQNLLKKLPVEMLGALLMGALFSLIKLVLACPDKFDETTLTAGIEAIWEMIKH